MYLCRRGRLQKATTELRPQPCAEHFRSVVSLVDAHRQLPGPGQGSPRFRLEDTTSTWRCKMEAVRSETGPIRSGSAGQGPLQTLFQRKSRPLERNLLHDLPLLRWPSYQGNGRFYSRTTQGWKKARGEVANQRVRHRMGSRTGRRSTHRMQYQCRNDKAAAVDQR